MVYHNIPNYCSLKVYVQKWNLRIKPSHVYCHVHKYGELQVKVKHHRHIKSDYTAQIIYKLHIKLLKERNLCKNIIRKGNKSIVVLEVDSSVSLSR